MNEIFDILVIGGGINGAGIVRDASGRNLKVCLVEKNNFWPPSGYHLGGLGESKLGSLLPRRG